MTQNFANALGLLRTTPFYDCEDLPVTCSHTLAALNIIEAAREGVRGLDQKLTGNDGNIDQHKVLALCPSWKKPMEDGIPCIVSRRELEEVEPRRLDLVGGLRGAGGHAVALLGVARHDGLLVHRRRRRFCARLAVACSAAVPRTSSGLQGSRFRSS